MFFNPIVVLYAVTIGLIVYALNTGLSNRERVAVLAAAICFTAAELLSNLM